MVQVIIDNITKLAYLLTTFDTDKGTAFASTNNAEDIQTLGIKLNSATTKHPQTIRKMERSHALLKTNIEMASGENHRQW